MTLSSLSCALWGHQVDNDRFSRQGGCQRCRCGAVYLHQDGRTTRVRHTLSCFLGHHTYRRLIDRHGHHEYVCVRCGHPLLFRAESDPYADAARFHKKVRYLCSVLGHRVRRAATRHGFVEYACGCGHSFLKPATELRIIRHPLICVFAGHWIRFVTRRAGFAEYICRNCGHPFCFADHRTAAEHALAS